MRGSWQWGNCLHECVAGCVPLRVFEGVVHAGFGCRPQALHKVLCLICLGVWVLNEGLAIVWVGDGG